MNRPEVHPTDEFSLIEAIRRRLPSQHADLCTGIGDDAAVLKNPSDPECRSVVCTDTLVAGRHFHRKDAPADIGHKALAVNLSDLAAMGARPRWCLLNLTLPSLDCDWIDGLLDGFHDLLVAHGVTVIGGDTTAGPLCLSVTLIGEARTDELMHRRGAKTGDLVAISGPLGGAAYALQRPDCDADLRRKLHRPNPRLDIAAQIQCFAHAAIDVSDGLLADLGHICRASGVGAVIHAEQLPVDARVRADADWLQLALSGGDDYELCFTLPSEARAQLPAECRVIGEVVSGAGVEVRLAGRRIEVPSSGFNHFDHGN